MDERKNAVPGVDLVRRFKRELDGSKVTSDTECWRIERLMNDWPVEAAYTLFGTFRFCIIRRTGA